MMKSYEMNAVVRQFTQNTVQSILILHQHLVFLTVNIAPPGRLNLQTPKLTPEVVTSVSSVASMTLNTLICSVGETQSWKSEGDVESEGHISES